MKRAANVLGKSTFAAGCVSGEQIAVAAWPGAIGKKVAAHTRAVTLVDGKLLVDVEDVVWQKQLTTLKRQILSRIAQVMGAGVVKDLHFRVGVAKKMPARAEQVVRGLPLDDADRIEDPILRHIYIANRKRATA